MNTLFRNTFHSTQVPIENTHSKRHLEGAMSRTCTARDAGCQCRREPLTLVQRCANGILQAIGPYRWPQRLR